MVCNGDLRWRGRSEGAVTVAQANRERITDPTRGDDVELTVAIDIAGRHRNRILVNCGVRGARRPEAAVTVAQSNRHAVQGLVRGDDVELTIAVDIANEHR